jgi:hypothetical protein
VLAPTKETKTTNKGDKDKGNESYCQLITQQKMTPLTNAGCFFLVLVDKVVAQVNFLESSQDKDVFMEVEDKEEDAAEDNKDNQRPSRGGGGMLSFWQDHVHISK